MSKFNLFNDVNVPIDNISQNNDAPLKENIVGIGDEVIQRPVTTTYELRVDSAPAPNDPLVSRYGLGVQGNSIFNGDVNVNGPIVVNGNLRINGEISIMGHTLTQEQLRRLIELIS